MPLVIQFCGPSAAPKIICDHCQQAIADAKDGNYQWTHAHGCAEGQVTPVFFTHKACCAAFEASHGGRHAWGAIELEALPFFLMKNLRLSWQAAQAK